MSVPVSQRLWQIHTAYTVLHFDNYVNQKLSIYNPSSVNLLSFAVYSWSQPCEVEEHRKWLHQCKSGSNGRSPKKLYIDSGKSETY